MSVFVRVDRTRLNINAAGSSRSTCLQELTDEEFSKRSKDSDSCSRDRLGPAKTTLGGQAKRCRRPTFLGFTGGTFASGQRAVCPDHWALGCSICHGAAQRPLSRV